MSFRSEAIIVTSPNLNLFNGKNAALSYYHHYKGELISIPSITLLKNKKFTFTYNHHYKGTLVELETF